MKILALVGSYRKRGNTDQIIAMIDERLRQIAAEKQVPIEVEVIPLGQQDIRSCRGCRVCFDRGEEKCPNRDDLLGIKEKMRAADAVLVASPVYVDDVSGITKTWIDRLAHVCHRPEFAGKSAYLIATTGSTRTKHALDTLGMAMRTWGFHIVGRKGFKMGALMKPEETRTRYQQAAGQIAQDLFDSVQRQKAATPSFYSLMVFKIQQMGWQNKSDQETIDYQYWKNQGWFDPKCTFFIPHRASPVKVAMARLAGRIIAPFVA